MTENRSLEGTIRDARPGESADGANAPRINLSVLTVSHERFRIIRTYAQGGLGVVSIAHDVELDRVVAVKEMRVARPSDDDTQRFLLEARLTGQLDHPGIPPVYALGYFEDGRPFYAMRLVDGVTLRSAIKDFHTKYPAPDLSRQRSLQLRQLIGAVVSVCNTLRFAHSKGVLHRDIKPSNIMLGEYGETLLMDWGLAKSQRQSLPYSDLQAKAHQQRRRLEDPEDTGTGSVMGTPHYMSPEQAEGDVESINQRSEVYSVGATLYSILTGKPPFTGQTREEILEKVRCGDFLPPRTVDSRVPPELNAICMKAMALERGDRYADTGELATDIEHWLADESVPCYREPPSRRWQRWVKVHQALVAGLVALMATCIVGLLVGTYVVSVSHRQAVAARQDAVSAAADADKIAAQSRDLLSRTFVTTFNDRIRNVPGTEKSRLEILELFIAQFQQWTQARPNNFRDRHELATAIHQRAHIYYEMNQVDQTWADFLYARSIYDDLQQTPDRLEHGTSLLDRMYLVTDMAHFLNQQSSDARLNEAFAQSVYSTIVREADTLSETATYKAHLASACFQLARAKSRRERYNEAFELTQRACSLYQQILAPNSREQLDEQMHGGSQTAFLNAAQSQYELVRLAVILGDTKFGLEQAIQNESMLCEFTRQVPEDFELWLTQRCNQILMAQLGASSGASISLRDSVQLVLRQLDQASQIRPTHLDLLAAQVDAFMLLAEMDFYNADLDAAQANALNAWSICQSLSALGINSVTLPDRFQSVQQFLCEIAHRRGDIVIETMCRTSTEEVVADFPLAGNAKWLGK